MNNKIIKLASILDTYGFNSTILLKYSSPNEAKFAKSLNYKYIANKFNINPANVKEIDSLMLENKGFFTIEQLKAINDNDLSFITSNQLNPKQNLSLDERSLLVFTHELIGLDSLITDMIKSGEYKSGKLWKELNLKDDWTNPDFYQEAVNKLDQLQKTWHQNLAQQHDPDEEIENLLSYNVKLSKNGYDLIYVPAVDEAPTYKNIEGTSHDRIVLGNKLGICLGSESKLYQDNSEGKIYALCKNKEPKVCIRADKTTLYESRAKGNSNTPEKYIDTILWMLNQLGVKKLNNDNGLISAIELLYKDNYNFSSNSNYFKLIMKEIEKNPNFIQETKNQNIRLKDENTNEVVYMKNGKLHHEDGPAVIEPNGTKKWLQNGLLHRLDGPAIIQSNGSKWWYQNGKRHRLDGPAFEGSTGTKQWYQNDKLHRLDGPAIELNNGTKEWYQNDKLHRLDGPAREWANGSKEWYQNDKLHRLDGPAREWASGHKEWYQNGLLHRLNGPAVERIDGSKQWWIDGIQFSYDQFMDKINQFMDKIN